jgi:hypothetical protein
MESKGPAAKPRFDWKSSSLVLIAAILLAVVVGWSIFWFVASRQNASIITGWMKQEAQHGRIWSCPDQKVGGYPFTVTISCTNLLFQGEVFGKQLTGTVHGFRASAPLLRTDSLFAEMDPPFAAKSSDGALDIAMQWTYLALDLEGQPDIFERISLVGDGVTLQGTIGGTDVINGKVADFNSYVVLSPDRHDHAYDVAFAFNDGSFPALNTFLDTQLPVSVSLGATISQADITGVASLRDFLEKWRGANGQLDVTNARLRSGTISFDAGGTLGLDDEHRVKGKLQTEFGGLDKALRHLDVDPALLTVGQVLSNLLGNGGKDSAHRLKLPLTISDGRLAIGPVRTSIQIPPLY